MKAIGEGKCSVGSHILRQIKGKSLNSKDEKESREAFLIFSSNNDMEFLDYRQLKNLLRSLNFTCSKQLAKQLIEEFDFAGTKSIDLKDFQKIYLYFTMQKTDEEKLKEAFESASGGKKYMTLEDFHALSTTTCGNTIEKDNLAKLMSYLSSQPDDEKLCSRISYEEIRNTLDA